MIKKIQNSVTKNKKNKKRNLKILSILQINNKYRIIIHLNNQISKKSLTHLLLIIKQINFTIHLILNKMNNNNLIHLDQQMILLNKIKLILKIISFLIKQVLMHCHCYSQQHLYLHLYIYLYQVSHMQLWMNICSIH